MLRSTAYRNANSCHWNSAGDDLSFVARQSRNYCSGQISGRPASLYNKGNVWTNQGAFGRQAEIAEEDSLPALWQKAYPNLLSPKFRFWVIFNNQFRPVPVVTAPNWVAVISRSLETSSRAATATTVRHLFAMAEISRLKRNADVEVRVVSIPGDWVPPVPGVFKKRP